jgi:hypothetical protein
VGTALISKEGVRLHLQVVPDKEIGAVDGGVGTALIGREGLRLSDLHDRESSFRISAIVGT